MVDVKVGDRLRLAGDEQEPETRLVAVVKRIGPELVTVLWSDGLDGHCFSRELIHTDPARRSGYLLIRKGV